MSDEESPEAERPTGDSAHPRHAADDASTPADAGTPDGADAAPEADDAAAVSARRAASDSPEAGEAVNDGNRATDTGDAATDGATAAAAGGGAPAAAALASAGAAAARTRKRRGSRVKQLLLAALIGLLAIVLGVGIATYLHARHAISSIARDSSLLPTTKRSTAAPDGAMNFLILGADTRDYDPTDPGRSDTMIVAHVNKDRKHVYLVSITRDMWVPIHDGGYAKINYAYQVGGAPLAAETVQDLLGITIDHVALIDFQGFMKLTDVLGGVQVWNETEFTDSAGMGCVFPVGFVTVEGDCGLAFVRERKNSPNNDLGRAQRQRDVIKAIAQKALSAGVLANPVTANKLMDQVSGTFTLDSQWSNDDVLNFAMSLKLGSSDQIRSLQLPVGGYDVSSDGQDINVPDTEQLAEIAQGLQNDTMDDWWARHDATSTTQVTNDPAWPVDEGLAPEGTPTPRPTVPTPTETPAIISPTPTPTSKQS